VQKKNRDGGNNAQRDNNPECDPRANRNTPGKRGLTGWDSDEPREPFVEFHSISTFRIRRTLLVSGVSSGTCLAIIHNAGSAAAAVVASFVVAVDSSIGIIVRSLVNSTPSPVVPRFRFST
jgi:hypothetical protein